MVATSTSIIMVSIRLMVSELNTINQHQVKTIFFSVEISGGGGFSSNAISLAKRAWIGHYKPTFGQH